ncbi:MAG: deoxyribodipyrimidine photo-lyase [Chlamydiia bacterium]|nr:deoxyribodipyrimidine photo-lyase [Chlamydiia bacterium]MCP5506592.1 deoxyribodipyrimidine photo-lyase [Chlamydiales bacterium]
MVTFFWHQEDLRIDQNLALFEAAKEGPHVNPIYILPDREALGEASRWWLHHSLESLKKAYEKRGISLTVRLGDPLKIFEELGATKIFYNQTFSPVEKKVKRGRPFNGNHLVNIPEFFNKSGKPFGIFTPFYKALLKELSFPRIGEVKLKVGETFPSDDLDLLPKKEWIKTLEAVWEPGRAGALKRLKAFRDEAYETKRDLPAVEGTSRLSPHLHFGEVSPFEVWEAATSDAYQRQLCWREFGTYFITHYPHTPTENWQEKFDKFPWEKNPEALKKWQKGKTGYPIIDAGMRQLWKEGWMHNRVRMIVASFLIKDLFIHWKEGAAWFWDTLVDADLGNNTLGWQWVAGSGPDASPFFRIFNPTLQGEKFDPDGTFVKTYCPELTKLPPKWIHKPWEAPREILEHFGIVLNSVVIRYLPT